MDLRIGQGIDTHRLVAGRKLILGGIEIAHERGLDGHSDADVLVHSIIDALLGAVGKADIGTQFPNRDPRWRGADSLVLLTEVMKLVRVDRWRVVNVDSTILAEAPLLAPFIPGMRQRVAEVLTIEPAQIGIKAGTSEGLGALGRGEGISALAVVLLCRD